jgi:hypothetical protein
MIKSIFEFGLFPVYRGIVLFLFPTKWCHFFFKGIANDVKIGFSIIIVKELYLSRGTRISSFNLIRCEVLDCKRNVNISKSNTIYTNGSFKLGISSSIGNRNKFTSPVDSSVYISKGQLILRTKAIITSDHFFDLTDSIIIGENAVIAGKNSQFWTHSYTHSNHDRFRVDGTIVIGGNSYVGSSSIFLCASGIAENNHVGAGAIISKVYNDKGKIIVPTGVRIFDFIDKRSTMKKISTHKSCEDVYKK